ncbi:MAG TPA: dTMP kinase [Candidatus Binatia bacterium]|jgi:dTMP kinase
MGFFITLEGIEGCGKSTQARRLQSRLAGPGRHVVLTREPGGTATTAPIRALLADPASQLDPTAELMLFLADRAQHVATVIQPALAAGSIVVCDRYCDSTLAYQGYGRGHDLAWLEDLNRRASHGVVPDLTLWIDCAIETGLRRAKQRAGGPGDRFEIEPLAFHDKIRRGFAALATRFASRIVRIDGNRGEEEVASDCIAAVQSRLQAREAAQ